MSFLEVQHLSRQIEGLQVVNDICFSQQPLQKMAIAGETGSGKSNLLKIIAGFTQPDSGHVFFRGERVEGPWEKLIPGHPGIAYLSQQYELPKFLRVEQVLTYANKMTAGAAGELYEICRITHLMKRRTDQLSGGEQQRIAIARLLIGQPALLLLDEPFSNLDPIHKQLLKTVLNDAAERLQLSCLLTSHDPMDTLPWADDMLILKAGTIVQQGRPEAIYRNPVNTYVAGLSGPYNLLSPSLAAAFGLAAAPQGQQVFVRPETLQVVPDGRYTVSGEVVAKRFMGNGYELEVLAEADRLLARTRQQTIQAGDTIRLGLADHTPWFL